MRAVVLALAAAAAVHAVEPQTPVSAERQAVLVELKARGLVGPLAASWLPDEERLLKRMRRAESRDAFALLRRDAGSLRGLVVERRVGVESRLWLTKRGFERYQKLRSQDARRFFEEEGVDASVVFKLRDALGAKIFTAKGILTPEGDELYDRALDRYPVRWMTPDGKIASTDVRPGSDD